MNFPNNSIWFKDLLKELEETFVEVLSFDMESLGKGFLDNYTCNFRPVYSATKLLFHFM